VDEAQDFDEFKISILREMSMNDSFTFVGDLSQGIYSYRGIVDWKKTMERVFPQKEYQYHVLTTSYRSTIEIINLANEVIKKCSGLEVVLAEPILRHGHKPRLVKCDGEEAMFEELKKDIELLEKEGFYSRAILCKDLKTTEKVFERLNMDMENIHLITDRVIDYQGGTVVIPAYLSKGLEFDGVLLWNGNKESFTMDPIDVKLLYISLTRALHRLSIYYTGELSAILENMEACRAL
ncbi:MAG: UvrD-helicase domain-containing protein, partial [Thermotaleaceae bacterium]